MKMQWKTTLFLLVLLTTLVPLGLTGRDSNRILAQKAPEPVPTFTPPSSLAAGTQITIDGSPMMTVINQALEQGFKSRYPNATVILRSNGSEAALQSLLAGNLDLAAMGRPLTDAEIAQGLTQVPVSREKIAIIVGRDNPFRNDLTSEDFARVFRGEITNWSQLGGPNVPIRFIDRPLDSDMRQALGGYDLFKKKPFQNGANTVRLETDDTATLVRELGTDGISYAIAAQVLDQDTVRVLTMHGTLPNDPRYPYSQPRGYIYRGQPSPAIQAFLGFATNPTGEKVVTEAKADEAATVATADLLPGRLALSPDGQTLIQGTQDGKLVWHDNQGRPAGTAIQAHPGLITGLAFTPDGQTLISTGSDGTLRRWGKQGNPLGAPVKGSDGPITALTVSPNGQQIISGNEDGTIQRWSPEGLALGNPIQAHRGAVRAIAFGPKGQLFTGGTDGIVSIWNPDGTAVNKVENVHQGGVTALAASPDGALMVSGGADGTIQIWDANGAPKGNPIPAHNAPVTALAIGPDGQTIASAGMDNQFRLWDTQGRPKPVQANLLTAPAGGLVYRPDGNLLTSLASGVVQARDPQGQPLPSLDTRPGGDNIPDLSQPNFNLPPEITAALQNLPPSTWWIVSAVPVLLILLGLLWSLFGGRDDEADTDEVETETDPTLAGAAPPTGSSSVADQESEPVPVDATAGGGVAVVTDPSALPPESAWVGLDPAASQDLDLGNKLSQAKANLTQGNRQLQEGRYDEALNSFNTAIEAAEVERVKALSAGASLAGITVVLSQATAQRGETLARLGRNNSALDSFNRALETDDNAIAAWIGKGRLLANMGQMEEALFCFDKALELDPSSGPAAAGKGRILIQMGQPQEGQIYLDRATQMGGEDELNLSSSEALATDPGGPITPGPVATELAMPAPPAPNQSQASLTGAINADVPHELQQIAATLPSASIELQPAVPLAGSEVPQVMQAVVADLPDEPEVPEHALISASEIMDPDAMDGAPVPAATSSVGTPQSTISTAAPSSSDFDNPSLPAPEELAEVTQALQATVDLSTVALTPVAASTRLTSTPASVPATTPIPVPDVPPTASSATEALGNSGNEISVIVPDNPDQTATLDAPDSAWLAGNRPDNPDENNALADLPPDVAAAFTGIPADSPDSFARAVPPSPVVPPASTPPSAPVKAAAPASSAAPTEAMTAVPPQTNPVVLPPPVPANPRLVKPPQEISEPLPTSWITLSVPDEDDRLYAVWEISDWERTAAKRKGGEALVVRLYDVTEHGDQALLPTPVDEQECYELARDWYLALPRSKTAAPIYLAEIGYKTSADEWLSLARSKPLAVAAR